MWFRGYSGSAGLRLGLADLEGLFQLSLLYDSTFPSLSPFSFSRFLPFPLPLPFFPFLFPSPSSPGIPTSLPGTDVMFTTEPMQPQLCSAVVPSQIHWNLPEQLPPAFLAAGIWRRPSPGSLHARGQWVGGGCSWASPFTSPRATLLFSPGAAKDFFSPVNP